MRWRYPMNNKCDQLYRYEEITKKAIREKEEIKKELTKVIELYLQDPNGKKLKNLIECYLSGKYEMEI